MALQESQSVVSAASGDENILFSDLFDIEEIQKVQDAFAEATGVASIITGPDGVPITKPSCFCRLCRDIIRKSEKGLANCYKSDAALGKQNPSGPIMQPCLSGGLWDGGAGISVGGKHIANWLIGQVRNDALTDNDILKYAKEIDADEEEFKAALSEVTVMSVEQFKKICNALFLFANQLSQIAYQNYRQKQIIEERDRMSAELSKTKNYLGNIIDSMPSVLIGVDMNGQITHWNLEAQDFTGIACEAALGRPLNELMPYLSSDMEMINKAIAGQGKQYHPRRLRQENDRVFYEDVTVYPLGGNAEEGAVIRIDDVTKQTVLEQQLSHTRKMEAIGHLAGGVAHDLNNMLAGIVSASDILKSPARSLSQDDVEYVDMILQCARQAADLTSKLLAFARKGKTIMEPTDAHRSVNEAVAILRRTVDKKIIISVVTNAEDHIVLGDRSGLQNIILNLAINSTHAMPDGGVLSIATSNIYLDKVYCSACSYDINPGKYFKLEVRDTGYGIPQENIKMIFEPFYTTKEMGKGTGLGLSAVYGIVQSYHGAISVYSEEGKGTAFYIMLPCLTEDVVENTEDLTVFRGTGNILLVDDENIIRVTVKKILESMGYTVMYAKNGQEALDIFTEAHANIDLVIMDMIMPCMNGLEALKKMKELDSQCRVVISSGFSKTEELDELKKVGIAGFISKPYEKAELGRLLNDLLGGRIS